MSRSTPATPIGAEEFVELCRAIGPSINWNIEVTENMKAVADWPSPDTNPKHVVTLFVQARKSSHRAHQNFTIKKKHMANDLLDVTLTTLAELMYYPHGQQQKHSYAQDSYSINYVHPDHNGREALFMFTLSDRAPEGAATPPPAQHIPEPKNMLLFSALRVPATGGQIPFFGKQMIEDSLARDNMLSLKTHTKDKGYLVLKRVFVAKQGEGNKTVAVGLYMQIAPGRTVNEVSVNLGGARHGLIQLAGEGEGAHEIIKGAMFKFILQERVPEDYQFSDYVSNIDPNASSSSSPSPESSAPSPEAGQGANTKRGRSASSSSGHDIGKGKGISKGKSGGMLSGAKKAKS